ncbi:hypothetical protein [Endozoicomonas sp. ALB091]|uniref:hypothetical protein n=1 Tax=Endozoicomonas sp. ALB091 TaxID=3403073 RepID=UPI003BB52D59
MNIDQVVKRIYQITAPETEIQMFLGAVMTLTIHLKPMHKIEVCEEINKLLLPLKGKMQVILAVMDDDDDVYARLIGFGLSNNEINVDEWSDET